MLGEILVVLPCSFSAHIAIWGCLFSLPLSSLLSKFYISIIQSNPIQSNPITNHQSHNAIYHLRNCTVLGRHSVRLNHPTLSLSSFWMCGSLWWLSLFGRRWWDWLGNASVCVGTSLCGKLDWIGWCDMWVRQGGLLSSARCESMSEMGNDREMSLSCNAMPN